MSMNSSAAVSKSNFNLPVIRRGVGVTYPKGYVIKSIEEQVAILMGFFPKELEGAKYDKDIINNYQLPNNSEGWFAIPDWNSIASTYFEATNKVLTAISFTRKFCNHLKVLCGENQVSNFCLKQNDKTLQMIQKIKEHQKNNKIIVFPCQFGRRYQGRSVYLVRKTIENKKKEFGLGLFEVACLLLTHPERERRGGNNYMLIVLVAMLLISIINLKMHLIFVFILA